MLACWWRLGLLRCLPNRPSPSRIGLGRAPARTGSNTLTAGATTLTSITGPPRGAAAEAAATEPIHTGTTAEVFPDRADGTAGRMIAEDLVVMTAPAVEGEAPAADGFAAHGGLLPQSGVLGTRVKLLI